MSAVDAKHVNKFYGTVAALDDVLAELPGWLVLCPAGSQRQR